MKNLKLLVVAFVAILGFTACDKDCGHDFIEHDFSKELVGTWTSLNGELAEAMVIKEDGSFTTTGVMKGGSMYEEKGTIKVVNNKVTLAFEGDNEEYEGRLEFVAGKSLSIVMFDDNDVRLTYDYCANDLADEIVGMWVCNDSKVEAENDMMIQTFNANGITSLTGFLPIGDNNEYVLNDEAEYKVVGDLMFLAVPADKVGGDKPKYIAERLIYTPKATAHGDIMTFTNYSSDSNELSRESWLRIKQSLDLTNKKYDYHNIYVSNVKGEDKDIEFFNTTINFAKLNASALDKFLNATIFSIMFPDANTIKYSFLEGQHTTLDAPIVVEGNKMTIKMSAKKAVYRDVVVYAFQDADNTQMHIYMPTSSFETFFANGQIQQLEENGLIDINNAEAIAEVRNMIEAAIETINVSFIFKTAK